MSSVDPDYQSRIIAYQLAQQANAVKPNEAHRLIRLALIGAAVWFGVKAMQDGKLPVPWPNNGPNVPAPNLPAPSAEMQGILLGVKPHVAGLTAQQRTEQAALWRQIGETLIRDEAIVKTTEDVRTAIMRAGGLRNQKLGVGTKALGDSINAAIINALGDKPVALDASKRARAVEVCNAVAWAFEQGA